MERKANNSRTNLPPHTWMTLFLVVLSAIFVANGVRVSIVKSLVTLVMAAAIAIYVIVEVRLNGVKWTRYNILVMTMALLFLILTVIRRNYTRYTRGNLTLCLAALVIGVVPAHFTKKDVHHETLLLSGAVILAFLPLAIMALVSVFTARPIYLLDPERAVGIQTAGLISDRIFIGVHPNYAATICVQCILLAVYAYANTRVRELKVAFVAVMMVYFLALVHTQSRSGSILLGLSVGAFGFRWAWRRFERRHVVRLLVGILLVAISILLCIWLIDMVFAIDVRIALRLNPWIAKEQTSASRIVTEGLLNLTGNGRGVLWRGVLKYLRANPLTLLVGLGAQPVYRFIEPFTETDFWYVHLHNSGFEVLVRGGLPMLGLVVGMLLCLVRPCVHQLLGFDGEGERLSCIRPILVGIMLVVSVSEAMLFVYATFPNILFFIVSGQIILLGEDRRPHCESDRSNNY